MKKILLVIALFFVCINVKAVITCEGMWGGEEDTSAVIKYEDNKWKVQVTDNDEEALCYKYSMCDTGSITFGITYTLGSLLNKGEVPSHVHIKRSSGSYNLDDKTEPLEPSFKCTGTNDFRPEEIKEEEAVVVDQEYVCKYYGVNNDYEFTLKTSGNNSVCEGCNLIPNNPLTNQLKTGICPSSVYSDAIPSGSGYLSTDKTLGFFEYSIEKIEKNNFETVKGGKKNSSDNRDLTGGFTFGGGNCHAITRINEIMEDYINIPLKAVAILLLVGLTIVDFVKNIGDKEADPKKPFNKLVKRSIACAILFFATEIVDIILKLAGTSGSC